MMQRATLSRGSVSAYTIPTDSSESDGTFSWDSTTMVLVTIEAAGKRALGYTYADSSTARVAKTLIETLVLNHDAFDHGAIWHSMLRYVRNLGETGIAMMAISAIDNALWDLRARILDIPLVSLIGKVRDSIPVYGSGGFTTYTDQQLTTQFSSWAEEGLGIMKMKVGTNPAMDPHRVAVARKAIGQSKRLL